MGALFPGVHGAAPAVLLLGLLGGVLLCAAEVSAVVQIHVGDVVRASESGRDRHGWALLVLGVAGLGFACGAAVARSRAALVALAAIAVVALALWGLGDLPDAGRAGVFGAQYEEASAHAGAGLWLELAGGLCLLAAAGLGALAPGRGRGHERALDAPAPADAR